jgi:hypothetical protein
LELLSKREMAEGNWDDAKNNAGQFAGDILEPGLSNIFNTN